MTTAAGGVAEATITGLCSRARISRFLGGRHPLLLSWLDFIVPALIHRSLDYDFEASVRPVLVSVVSSRTDLFVHSLSLVLLRFHLYTAADLIPERAEFLQLTK